MRGSGYGQAKESKATHREVKKWPRHDVDGEGYYPLPVECIPLLSRKKERNIGPVLSR